MPEPIEIKASDIIKRPTELINAAGKITGGKNPIAQIREYVKQAQEIKKMLEEIGIPLNNLIPGLGGLGKTENKAPVNDDMRPPPPAAQFRMFMMMLIAKYGDITFNELIERMREEYGNRKLSQM